MNFERVDSPLAGSIASVPVIGRFALILECGLSCIFTQGVNSGNPVIGGQILDLKRFENENALTELVFRGESSNALGLRHRITVVSSDSLEELQAIQPPLFTPFKEFSGTAPGPGLYDIGGNRAFQRLLVPGRVTVWLKNSMPAAGPGSMFYVIGPDKLPAVGIAYISENMDEADSQGMRLPATNVFTRITTKAIVEPCDVRGAATTVGADVYIIQIGSVGL